MVIIPLSNKPVGLYKKVPDFMEEARDFDLK